MVRQNVQSVRQDAGALVVWESVHHVQQARGVLPWLQPVEVSAFHVLKVSGARSLVLAILVHALIAQLEDGTQLVVPATLVLARGVWRAGGAMKLVPPRRRYALLAALGLGVPLWVLLLPLLVRPARQELGVELLVRRIQVHAPFALQGVTVQH